MHESVLLHELTDALALKEDSIVVDATLNGAGHSREIINRLGAKGILIGIDLDSAAIEDSSRILAGAECTVRLIEDNFKNLDRILRSMGIHTINAICFDLGLSSNQLSHSGRGFSFERTEPLQMTFKSNPGGDDLTAHRIVNEWDEAHIADVIYGYGEERFARRIASRICDARRESPIKDTHTLAEIVKSAVPHWYRLKRIHPATRTFQALRIAVNDEIENLREGLQKALLALSSRGRIAVISFHSIEDRVVKRFFIGKARDGEGVVITKKPITPSREEVERNRRARSAKLRIFEKK